MSPEQAAHCREKENLRLARQRVLHQIETAANPRHKELLEASLSELDERLRKLD